MNSTPTLHELMTNMLQSARETDWSVWQGAPGDVRITAPMTADQPPLTHGIVQVYLSFCALLWQRPIQPEEQERVVYSLRSQWAADGDYSEQYKILSFAWLPSVLQTMAPEEQDRLLNALAREIPDGVFPGVDTQSGTFPGLDAVVPHNP